MTTRFDWENRVGDVWAAEWQRTDRSFAGLTDQLLTAARQHRFRQAVDIGCGAGELSMALGRSHSGASVVGVDISPQLIETARERSGQLPNVSYELADMGTWQPGSFQPDLLLSRHGVMFFDDPVAAFTHMRNIAHPAARLVFSCFRSQEENSWADRIVGMLPPGTTVMPDRFSPGPFAFAEREHVEGILTESGWQNVIFEPVDYAYIAGAGDNAVADAMEFFQRIGPAARAAAMLEGRERDDFLVKLRRYVANNDDRGLVAFRGAAWIVSASSR